jgi:hypothetical protein
VDNIKMDLGEIGWGGMDWIDLAQDREQWRGFTNTVINLGSFSRRVQLHEVSSLVLSAGGAQRKPPPLFLSLSHTHTHTVLL